MRLTSERSHDVKAHAAAALSHDGDGGGCSWHGPACKSICASPLTLLLLPALTLRTTCLHRSTRNGSGVRDFPAIFKEGIGYGTVRFCIPHALRCNYCSRPYLKRYPWPRYLSTHPSHADRIAHLQDTVQLKRQEMLQRFATSIGHRN